MSDETENTIKSYVRVIYRPKAGRAKLKLCKLTKTGDVTINGGTHTVGELAMFTWKGKHPWVIINQTQVPARNIAGDVPSDPSPQFFNEAVTNRYASDVLNSMEEFGKKNTTQTIILVMLGAALLVSFIFGIWTIATIGGLHDQVNALNAALHPIVTQTPGTDTTVVHHA